MKGFSRLAARGAAVLVLASTSAWAQQQEELWLDTRSSAPVASQVGLKKGWPYLITMQGTYNVWGDAIVPGAKSNQPEAAPMFPSPNAANRNVGFDPEFVFAWPKGHAMEKSPEPAPRRVGFIEISLDGGKTWKHPATTASFNAPDHKYGYEVTGEDSPLQVRIADKPVADNSGRLRIFAVPAEEVWLDTRSAAPVPSKLVLQKGKPYRVTLQGTFNVWGTNIVPGTKSSQPEAAPMFPSPNAANRNVGFDPEFVFAWPKDHAMDKSPDPAPRRLSAIELSLDGGKTWKHPASTAAFSATDHKYTYDLTGEDSALQVRIADKPVTDNSGLLRILVLPGA